MGSDYADEDIQKNNLFKGLSRSMTSLLWVFRCSIGDVAHPSFAHWTEVYDKDQARSGTMITVVWAVMIYNQLALQVVLFNFLIAIVTDSYIKVMQQRMVNSFNHKADLINEYFLTRKFIHNFFCKIEKPFDILFVMSPDEYEPDQVSDWTTFFKNFRHHIFTELKKDKEDILDYVEVKLKSLASQMNLKVEFD